MSLSLRDELKSVCLEGVDVLQKLGPFITELNTHLAQKLGERKEDLDDQAAGAGSCQ